MDILSTSLMVLQSILFVSAWLCLARHVHHSRSVSGAQAISKYHNRLYSAASLGLLVLILSPSHDDVSRTAYHGSKFYEYIDIFSVVASGGPVSLHFGFHHLTTPWLTFIRVLDHNDGWKWFAAFNAGHHVLMYAYFGGFSRVRPVLPWTGSLQLVVGISVDIWVARNKMQSGASPIWPNIFSAGLLAIYLFLTIRDLRFRAKETAAERKSIKNA